MCETAIFSDRLGSGGEEAGKVNCSFCNGSNAITVKNINRPDQVLDFELRFWSVLLSIISKHVWELLNIG